MLYWYVYGTTYLENSEFVICNTEDLGDEFHYLLKCDCFNEKRKTCIDKKYFDESNQKKKAIHFYKINK